MNVKARTITIQHRVILALSALEEARLADLYDFFKNREDRMNSNTIQASIQRMKRAGHVTSEVRRGEHWWRLHTKSELKADKR